jgi:tol-pal system protein YbgF
LIRRPLFAIAAALAVLAGCASGGPGRSASKPADDVEELKRRVLELQRRVAMADVEIARLRQAVADLQGRSGAAGSSSPPRSSPPAGAPAGRSSIPEPAPAPAPPRIDERDLAAADIPPSATEPESAATPVTPEAQAAYDHAYTLYHQGRFVDAETAFRRFLQTWPRTDLADNASYWIGECRYSRGDLRSALAAFQEAVERFPGGNKTPDALYKAGQCLEGLGDVESARQSYQAVLERFPGEPAADLARQRLRVIG